MQETTTTPSFLCKAVASSAQRPQRMARDFNPIIMVCRQVGEIPGNTLIPSSSTGDVLQQRHSLHFTTLRNFEKTVYNSSTDLQGNWLPGLMDSLWGGSEALIQTGGYTDLDDGTCCMKTCRRCSRSFPFKENRRIPRRFSFPFLNVISSPSSSPRVSELRWDGSAPVLMWLLSSVSCRESTLFILTYFLPQFYLSSSTQQILLVVISKRTSQIQ